MSKPTVLIIEGDTNKLKQQGLRRAKKVAVQVGSVGGSADIWRIDRMSDLRAGAEARSGRRYTAVVVIGHGCQLGVQLTADSGLTEWKTLAKLLRPWQPASIGFISCTVGRSRNARTLFRGVPTLKEVIASKTVVTADQADVLPMMVSRLLQPQRVSETATAVGQTLYALATGGILARYERAAVLARSNGDQSIVSILEEVMTPIASEALRELIRTSSRRHYDRTVLPSSPSSSRSTGHTTAAGRRPVRQAARYA